MTASLQDKLTPFRQPGTELVVEKLGRKLVEEYVRRVMALYRQYTDQGRAAFEARLTKKESIQRSIEATDEDWAAWIASLKTIPDPEVRLAETQKLFEQWSEAIQAKALLAQMQRGGEPVMPELVGLMPGEQTNG